MLLLLLLMLLFILLRSKRFQFFDLRFYSLHLHWIGDNISSCRYFLLFDGEKRVSVHSLPHFVGCNWGVFCVKGWEADWGSAARGASACICWRYKISCWSGWSSGSLLFCSCCSYIGSSDLLTLVCFLSSCYPALVHPIEAI